MLTNKLILCVSFLLTSAAVGCATKTQNDLDQEPLIFDVPIQIIGNQISADGVIDKGDCVRRVRIYLKRFLMCVDVYKLEEANEVTTTIDINKQGQVEKVHIAKSNLSDSQNQCILSIFKTLPFPEPKSSKVTIQVPLLFSPQKKKLEGTEMAH